MIKINLLPEVRSEKVAKAPLVSFGGGSINNYILLGLLVVGVGVVGVLYWQLSSKLSDVMAELAENQREYERLKPIIAEVDAFKKKNAELKHKIQVINDLKRAQFGPVRIMDEVSKALPDLLWLTKMDLTGHTVKITGQALNENAVANFISNLDASPFFAEPSLSIMRQSNAGVFDFDLSCTFVIQPQEATAAATTPSQT